jgi:DNA-binding transcriptional LysR family regulator
VSKLPDLEGLAIFAKIVQMRSFIGAAAELRLSKATGSKAVSRIEKNSVRVCSIAQHAVSP